MNAKYHEHRHRVTFADTNAAGNVYFAHYFFWQGECREAVLAEHYPEFEEDLKRGFGLVTDYATMDYHYEGRLFDEILIRMYLIELTRSRMEFRFEFIRGDDDTLLAEGKQAVVWVNEQQRPSLMPDKLYGVLRQLAFDGSTDDASSRDR
jgi:enediyne biosynthesis thioesterase